MMKFSLIAALLILGATAVLAGKPSFTPCGGAKVVELDIEGCDASGCQFVNGKSYKLHATFQPRHKMVDPLVSITHETGDWKLPAEIAGVSKPADAHEEQTVDYQYRVFSDLDQAKFRFAVFDLGDTEIEWPEFCVDFEAKVSDEYF